MEYISSPKSLSKAKLSSSSNGINNFNSSQNINSKQFSKKPFFNNSSSSKFYRENYIQHIKTVKMQYQ